jgi:hypothetical protein
MELGNIGPIKLGGKMYHGVGIKRLISVSSLRLSVCVFAVNQELKLFSRK